MVEFGGVTAIEVSDVETIVLLKDSLRDQTLPIWSTEGWDRQLGGFVERLGGTGYADLAVPRRVRVQARQIYCFAKAAHLGWYPKGAFIAREGLDYLLAKAKSPEGKPGFVHLLAPDGSVLNSLRDTYDHAFILLALATVYQLDRDVKVRVLETNLHRGAPRVSTCKKTPGP